MRKKGVYEVFVGMIYYLTENITSFTYSEDKFINFMKSNRGKYGILKGFTDEEIKHDADVITWFLFGDLKVKNPREVVLDRNEIEKTFNTISEKKPFGSLSQLERLSKDFARELSKANSS